MSSPFQHSPFEFCIVSSLSIMADARSSIPMSRNTRQLLGYWEQLREAFPGSCPYRYANGDREVRLGKDVPDPAGIWFLREKKHLLMDRHTKFSEAFRGILEESGVKAARLPPRSPNLNPNLERFMRSIKEECLERIMEYVSYYTSSRSWCAMFIRYTTTPLAGASQERSVGQWFKQEMLGIGSNNAQEPFFCVRPGGVGMDPDLACNLR